MPTTNFAFSNGQFVAVPMTDNVPGQVIEQHNSLRTGKSYTLEYRDGNGGGHVVTVSEVALVAANPGKPKLPQTLLPERR